MERLKDDTIVLVRSIDLQEGDPKRLLRPRSGVDEEDMKIIARRKVIHKEAVVVKKMQRSLQGGR